nr:MAG TPA: hypothetical protein [Caudoviricetes sp.]
MSALSNGTPNPYTIKCTDNSKSPAGCEPAGLSFLAVSAQFRNVHIQSGGKCKGVIQSDVSNFRFADFDAAYLPHVHAAKRGELGLRHPLGGADGKQGADLCVAGLQNFPCRFGRGVGDGLQLPDGLVVVGFEFRPCESCVTRHGDGVAGFRVSVAKASGDSVASLRLAVHRLAGEVVPVLALIVGKPCELGNDFVLVHGVTPFRRFGWLASVGKLIDEGLHRVGVPSVINGELYKLDNGVGVVLGRVLADVIGAAVESPRNVDTAAVVIAGFLPAVSVGGVKRMVEVCPVGRFFGKVEAVKQEVSVRHKALSFLSM